VRVVHPSLIVPLVVAVSAGALGGLASSWAYWKLVGEEEVEMTRVQAHALAAWSDVRVSLAEFERQAPSDLPPWRQAKYAEALAHWRQGRALLLEGRYGDARADFRKAAWLLVVACGDCENVLPPG
jgi:hypothetical protein